MKTGKLVVAVLIILAGSLLAKGQVNPTDPTLETGLKASGSYHGGDIDSVSLTNGNLTVHISLPGYTQRGSLTYTPRIIYNSKGNWYVNPNCNSVTGICSPFWAWSLFQNPMGHGVVLDVTDPDESFGISWQPQYPHSLAFLISATTPDGSTHPFGGLQSGGMTTSIFM